MVALGSRPLLLMCILILVVLTLVVAGKSGREYFDTQTATTATPITNATIPMSVNASIMPATPVITGAATALPATVAATPTLSGVPTPIANPQQSITSMVPSSTVLSAAAPPSSGTVAPITSSVTSTTNNASAAPGTPALVPTNAMTIVSAAISPPVEIPPWQDDVIGNWQLIQFDSMSLPTDVVGLSSDPGVNGVYAVRVVNPQHYYFVCTLSDVARLGLTSTSPISTGHKPSEYPLGYGGATCSQTTTAPSTQALTIGTQSVAAAGNVPVQTQSMSATPPTTGLNTSQTPTYVAGSSPPLIQTNINPTKMSLPFADCPFQASNISKYDPLFDELHNIQTQMQDDTSRLKFISDRLHRMGKQNYYPMPLAESNAAY